MRTERAIPIPAQFEFRSTDGGHHLEGYAAVFNTPSSPMPYTETVAPGAFARSLTQPPNGRQTLVVDHDDSQLLASTKTGRLRLAEDSTGLHVDADLVDTSYARDLRELSDAGELGGMSFEFSGVGANGAPFSADKRRRTLKEVRLYHVTVLTGKAPAYAETTAAVRALSNQIGAEYSDVATLFDAVREGRRLSTDEWAVLGRAVDVVAPDGLRWSSAAEDASSAAYVLTSLYSLLGDETDDTTQAGYLKSAINAVQQFIASESDEIGTPEDQADSADPMAGMMRSTPNLAAARALLGIA